MGLLTPITTRRNGELRFYHSPGEESVKRHGRSVAEEVEENRAERRQDVVGLIVGTLAVGTGVTIYKDSELGEIAQNYATPFAVQSMVYAIKGAVRRTSLTRHIQRSRDMLTEFADIRAASTPEEFYDEVGSLVEHRLSNDPLADDLPIE